MVAVTPTVLFSSAGLIAGLVVALVQMSRAQRETDQGAELARRAGLVHQVMLDEIQEDAYRTALGSPEAIAWAEAHRTTLTSMEALRNNDAEKDI